MTVKIGLFGGSFNPVHFGHLTAAQRVLEFTDCNQIWFLPAFLHPFKKKRFSATRDDIIKMLKLALMKEKKMKLSLFEIRLGEKKKKESKTIETVREIKKKHPEKEFKWVIGSNLVKEIKHWYKARELIKEIQFIVVPIKGARDWRKEKWLQKNNSIILPKKAAVKNISSSKIRSRIQTGESVSGLVPERVEEYLAEKLLYLEGKEFRKKVLQFTKLIPKGRVSTYKQIAIAINKPNAFQAVGNALNKNPFPSIIPCHRVIESSGKTGGFSKGIEEKKKMLKSEGLTIKNSKIKNFKKRLIKASELKKLNLGK